MSVVTIPQGYQYVGAALLGTVYLLSYQVRCVAKLRGISGVKYPQLYAERAEAEANFEAKKFNCAQRAHQGTLEFLPIIYTITSIAGLRFPRLSAAGCVLWTIGRFSFTRGYITGDPQNRVTPLSRLSYVPFLGLLLASTYVAGGWVVDGISAALKAALKV